MSKEVFTVALEKYNGPSSRYPCPSCGKFRKFTRYIDVVTGEYIGRNVGLCDRVDSCGYHYTPKQYYEDNKIHLSSDQMSMRVEAAKRITKPKPKEPSYIDYEAVTKSNSIVGPNTLEVFIASIYGTSARRILERYRLGSYNLWGEINPIYWQIDRAGMVRTGKVMRYDPATGKRIKDKAALHWYHALHKTKGFNMVQCLYGEHLLPYYPDKVVGVVESEKTALIAAIELNHILWLATGGKSNLSISKMNALQDRRVILYPDAGSYDSWSIKADEISKVVSSISVSDLLERETTAEQNGDDIADFLLLHRQGGAIF